VIVPPGEWRPIADGDRGGARRSRCGADPRGVGRRRVETDLSFEARMNAVEAIYVELFQRRSGENATHLATART
jgi:hypothetical protein